MEIRINPKKLTRVLITITVVLTVLHIWSCMPVILDGRSYPIGYFNFDREGNFPTLFATFLLGLCSFATFVIAHAEKGNKEKGPHWGILSLAFLLVAIDEMVMLHDKLSEIVRAALQTTGFFYFAWVLPYFVILVIFVIAYIPFYLRLPLDTRKLITLAAFLYVVGGMGFELAGGAQYEACGHDAFFYLLSTIEELLEFSGCIIFVYAFFSYIDKHLPDFRLRISSS